VASPDADEYASFMQTRRTTLNLDATLIKQVQDRFPGQTTTALIEQGLRALLAKNAAQLLIAMGGTAPRARRPRRKQGTDD
jgi:hypothetical protein